MAGAINAYTTDNVGGAGRVDAAAHGLTDNNGVAFQIGQKFGDATAVLTSGIETFGSGALEFVTGGAASAVSIPVAVHGVTTFAVAAKNLVTSKVTAKSSEEPGSYTNEHESGKQYHGKGTEKRAAQSGAEKAKENNDPLKNTDWTPAKNSKEAFKQEDKRLQKGGGPSNPNNYNKINSPGKKYNQQDGAH